MLKIAFPVSVGSNFSAKVMVAAYRLGLEGLTGKRKDSRYVHRRSPEWIKLKCGLRQEFVVGGFSKPSGFRLGMSSLLLGVYDKRVRWYMLAV